MSKFSKDTPAQARERLQWILDVVRANQPDVSLILEWSIDEDWVAAKSQLRSMHKNDRDAILQEGGILTTKQIELLK